MQRTAKNIPKVDPVRCPVAGHTHQPVDAAEALRCECGRLLARILKSAVELKCVRCKRVVILMGGRRFELVGAAGCACLDNLRDGKGGEEPSSNGPDRGQ